MCAPVTLVFARGSTEQGNMGATVGPALAKSLISSLGNSGVAIQGVDYIASIEVSVSPQTNDDVAYYGRATS